MYKLLALKGVRHLSRNLYIFNTQQYHNLQSLPIRKMNLIKEEIIK